MRKYLILTVTAGEGHNSIATAIERALLKDPENAVQKIDVFKEFSSVRKFKFINNGYIWACKHFPNIYNRVFRIYQKRNPEKRNSSPVQRLVKRETPKLLKYVNDSNPDVIICSHFFPAIILTNLKKESKITIPVVSILPDYTVHPFHECANGIDYFILPDESLKFELLHKGYKEEQLKPFGIPTKPEFYELTDKATYRKQLGFSNDLPLVMVMFGGGGFGKSKETLKQLLKCKHKIQIAIVNGKDLKSKERIDKLLQKISTQHIIKNYGFIDFVHAVMGASDILIGKAGGVSVNESLNKDLPLALSNDLIAQEYDNKKFLMKKNACINLTKKYGLTKAMDDLCDNPEKLAAVKNNIQKIKKPNAIIDLINLCKTI